MQPKKLLKTITNSEIASLSDHLLRIFSSCQAMQGDFFLQQTFSEMKNLSSQITEAINQTKPKGWLTAADQKRDKAIRNLGNVIIGYCSMPADEVVCHGLALKHVFDKFGKRITLDSYDIKSSYISSMIMDLRSEDMRPHVEALQYMRQSIDVLEECNNDFLRLSDLLDKERLRLKSGNTATFIRPQLLNNINQKLVIYLRAMCKSGDFKYVDFAMAIDNAICRSNEILEARKKRTQPIDSETEVEQ